MRKRRIIGIVLALFLLLGIFAASPVFPFVRSVAVMSVYSRICEKDSIMADEGFHIEIPGGGATKEKDWYPFVMTFNDDAGFSSYIRKPGTRLSILYNFPAFSFSKGASLLYDETSPLYNAFYGAYVVQLSDGEPYALKYPDQDASGNEDTDGSAGNPGSGGTEALQLDPEEIRNVAAFDYSRLVLGDFGLKEKDFICAVGNVQQEQVDDFISEDTWVRLTCDLNVSGAAHNPGGFVQSYLQYGTPGKFSDAGEQVKEPFKPVLMKSVVYARYFPEYKCSVFFYAMAEDKDVLRNCEERILKKSVIRPR